MRPAILGGEEVEDCEEEDVTEKLPLSAVYTENVVNLEQIAKTGTRSPSEKRASARHT